MIDAKALPEVKKHLETLANQLSLFENKVKDASESYGNTIMDGIKYGGSVCRFFISV